MAATVAGEVMIHDRLEAFSMRKKQHVNPPVMRPDSDWIKRVEDVFTREELAASGLKRTEPTSELCTKPSWAFLAATGNMADFYCAFGTLVASFEQGGSVESRDPARSVPKGALFQCRTQRPGEKVWTAWGWSPAKAGLAGLSTTSHAILTTARWGDGGMQDMLLEYGLRTRHILSKDHEGQLYFFAPYSMAMSVGGLRGMLSQFPWAAEQLVLE